MVLYEHNNSKSDNGGNYILPNKYKTVILAIIGITILAIFLFSKTALFSPAAEQKADTEEPAGIAETEEKSFTETEFKAANDPFLEFTRARNDKKPIMLEFYARW